ncbi:MAG: hypothetical protein AB7G75_28175 [Candidatus Binatia bacterium]
MPIGSYSDIVLTLVTAVLAWVTYKLAQHTKTLSDFTRQLVAIEEARDLHQKQEKRRTEIARGLELIEKLRKVAPEEFVAQLNQPGRIPEPTSSDIRELALLASRHVTDPDSVQYLKELRQILDSVEQGSSIGANGPEIAKNCDKFKTG